MPFFGQPQSGRKEFYVTESVATESLHHRLLLVFLVNRRFFLSVGIFVKTTEGKNDKKSFVGPGTDSFVVF